MSYENLIDAIDELLPQTQCGLCGYGACRPYAEAIAKNKEEINRCPPGGTKTLHALGTLLNQEVSSYLEEMALKEKKPSLAIIREAECIGCTKCIQACPVDAILGSAKKMHTVIATECTGCELCIAPCPVDCIDMVLLDDLPDIEKKGKSKLARKRYQARQKRLEDTQNKEIKVLSVEIEEKNISKRQEAIKSALERARAKKEQCDGP